MPRILYPVRPGLGGDPYIPPPTAIGSFSGGGGGNRYRSYTVATEGNAAGFTVWGVVRVEANTFASQKILGNGNNLLIGWGIDSEPAGYRFRIGSTSGGGTTLFSPDAPFSAIGLVDRIACVFDWAAMRLRTYLNSVEVGVATVFTGLPVFDTAAAHQTSIGSGSTGGDPAVDYSVLACGYAPVISSAADILAWDAAVQTSVGLAALPGATVQWRAPDAGSPPGTPWLDAISGASLARDGAPTALAFTPVWA